MLTQEVQLRVKRQVTTITTAYQQAKAIGYNIAAVSLPSFESQEDHDLYHPDDAGQAFSDANEFVDEIRKGLQSNGIPAELVVIRFPEYSKWLEGRSNSKENRSAFGAHLLAKKKRAGRKP